MTSQLNSIHIISKGFRLLVAGLSRRRHEFNASPVHVGLLMFKLSLEKDFLLVLRFAPVSTFPPMTHSHILSFGYSFAEKYAWKKSHADCVLPNLNIRLPERKNSPLALKRFIPVQIFLENIFHFTRYHAKSLCCTDFWHNLHCACF
jgi:hypothetical protein